MRAETETFNTLSHLAGLGLAFAALVALVSRAAAHADAACIGACSVYGVSLVLLYASSTLYHSLGGRAKSVVQRLDHSAIYLLIAGSYTPFAVVTLHGPRGTWLLAAVWAFAAVGILYEVLAPRRRRLVSVSLYVAMGWLAVLVIRPLARALPAPGFFLLVAGGLFYTAGVPFYALDKRLRWGHGAFHLFVLAGSAAHFAAIFGYVA